MPRINSSPRRPDSLALALAFVFVVVSALAQDVVPAVFQKGRYDALRDRSPFAVATAAPEPVRRASFATNWYVSGIARLGDADFVTIKSRDLAVQFSLFARETDQVTGVALASVNWSDHVGKSTVILRKGTETAQLEFNEAAVRGPIPAVGTTATPSGGKASMTYTPAANPAAASITAKLDSVAAVRRRSLPIPVPPR